MARKEIVCRCEEVSRAEIMEAMQKGDATLDAVKRRTRAGMGYCQGKTCKRMIAAMLAAYYELPVDRFLPGSIRMPIGPVKLSVLAEVLDGQGGEAL